MLTKNVEFANTESVAPQKLSNQVSKIETTGKLRPTTKRNPCPVCGDTKGKCRTTEGDLVLCMETDHSIQGWHYLGQSKDGLWGKLVPTGAYTPAVERIETQRETDKAIVSDVEKDKNYRAILNQLSLSDRHLEDFTRRGLTSAEIAYISGFARSLPDGYLIPFPNVNGKLCGAQKRLDHAEGGRYRWHYIRYNWDLNNEFNEKPLAVWSDGEPVWIIEGTGVKPIVSSIRHGITAIGAAGGQHYNSPQTLADTLEKLGNPSGVVFCPDAGDIHNRQVLRRIESNLEVLQGLGVTVTIAWWGQDTKDKPDIDEISNLDGVRYLSPAEFWAIVPHRPENRILRSRPLGFGRKVKHTAQKLGDDNAIVFEKGDRLKTVEELKGQGFRYVLDITPPGNGKTYDSGLIKPSEFGLDRVFYISDQHNNPTVPTLEPWHNLEGRHDGMVAETKPDGTKILRRRKDGEAFNIVGNCSRTHMVGRLREARVNGADSAALVCGGCPLREMCSHAEGDSFGFLHQRGTTLKRERIRAHLDSLPVPEEFDYAQSMAIVDEDQIRAFETIEVNLADVALAIADENLEVFPALLGGLKALKRLMESGEMPRYGFQHSEIAQGIGNIDVEVETIEGLTQPNLDFLNPTADQGVDLADLPRELRKHYSRGNSEAIGNIRKQWLGAFLRVLNGDLTGGSLAIDRRGMTITIPNDSHRRKITAMGFTLFTDSTMTRADLAQRLGVDPNAIAVIAQEVPPAKNLKRLQVSDLGAVTRNRGNDQEERIAAIVSHYKTMGHTLTIDFKDLNGDGAWWVDSRGSNAFMEAQNLILVGTPYENLGACLAQYCAEVGAMVTLEDQGFKDWYDRRVTATITQGCGRIRADRREQENLTVVLLSDFPLEGWEQIKAEEITPEAAPKVTRIWNAIQKTALDLMAEGKKVTQETIAAIVGITQGRISQLAAEFCGSWGGFKKLLILLLESHSKINNFSPPEDDLVEEAETIAQVLTDSEDKTEFWESFQTIFEGYGVEFCLYLFQEWGEMWRSGFPPSALNQTTAKTSRC